MKLPIVIFNYRTRALAINANGWSSCAEYRPPTEFLLSLITDTVDSFAVSLGLYRMHPAVLRSPDGFPSSHLWRDHVRRSVLLPGRT